MRKIIVFVFFIAANQSFALNKDDFSARGNLQFNSFFYESLDEKQSSDPVYVPEGLLNLQLKLFLSDDWQIQSEVEARYNDLGLEQGVIDESQFYRPYFSLEELYLRLYLQDADFYLGVKKINWGIADRFNPLDIINPVDLTDLVYERKIGLPLLAINYFPGQWQIEAVAAPIFIPSRLPPADSYFHYGDDLEIGRTLPQKQGVPWQFGLRISRQEHNLKLVSLFYSGYDSLPFIDVRMAGITDWRLHYSYKKMQALGGGFVYSAEKIVLRGEAAYYFYPDLPAEDYGQYVLGGDYNFGQVAGDYNLYLTLQYIGESPEKKDPYRVRHLFTNAVSGKVIFGDEFFSASLEGIYDFPDQGTIIIPSLAYTFQNNLTLQLEYNYFSGETGSFWEFMEQNKRFIFRVTYAF